MTSKTKAELQSQINTLLPDNTNAEISPEDVRTNFIDATDSLIFYKSTAPASSTEACVVGDIRVAGSDPYYMYVCVASNLWRRTELAPF